LPARRQAFPPHRIAGHIADFGGKGHGDEEGSAAHRLIRCHNRRHGPIRHDDGQLLLQTAQSLTRIFNGVIPS